MLNFDQIKKTYQKLSLTVRALLGYFFKV